MLPYETKTCPKYNVRRVINDLICAYLNSTKQTTFHMLSLPAGKALHEKMLKMRLINRKMKPGQDFHFDGVEFDPVHTDRFAIVKQNASNWLSIENKTIFDKFLENPTKYNVVYADYCGTIVNRAEETAIMLEEMAKSGKPTLLFNTLMENCRAYSREELAIRYNFPDISEKSPSPVLLNYLANKLTGFNISLIMHTAYSNKTTKDGREDPRARMHVHGFAINCSFPHGKPLASFNVVPAWKAKKKAEEEARQIKILREEMEKASRINSSIDNLKGFSFKEFLNLGSKTISTLLPQNYEEYSKVLKSLYPSIPIGYDRSLRKYSITFEPSPLSSISKENIQHMTDLFLLANPEYSSNTYENFKIVYAFISSFYSGCHFSKEKSAMISSTLVHYLKRYGNAKKVTEVSQVA